jgi:hypothetical protein
VKRVALVLLPLLAAGCVGMGSPKLPPPKTLSHAEFVRAADRACMREVRGIHRLKKPTSRAAALRYLDDITRTFDRLIFDLHRIAAPPAASASFRRLVAAANGADLVVNRGVAAAEAGHRRSVRIVLRRLAVVGKRFIARARKLGLHTCAEH